MIKKPTTLSLPVNIKNKTPNTQSHKQPTQKLPVEEVEEGDTEIDEIEEANGKVYEKPIVTHRTSVGKLPSAPKQNKKDLPTIIFSSIDLQTQQLSGTYNAKNYYDAAKHCFISRNRMRSIRREVQLESEVITVINLSNKQMNTIKLTRYATTNPTSANLGGKEVIFKSNIVCEEIVLPK